MKILLYFSDTFYMKLNLLVPMLILLFLQPVLSASEQTPYESGFASWYGGKFQGRKTASGEIFDTNLLTAAHKTLPFGTVVKVTNLENGKTVVVRINDRGPFVEGRIIDLSQAAAEEIGMLGAGVARVNLEIVFKSTPQYSGPAGTVTVQVGAYKSRENAEKIKAHLKKQGLNPDIQVAPGGIHRIVITEIPESDLEGLLRKLKSLGYGSPLIKKNF